MQKQFIYIYMTFFPFTITDLFAAVHFPIYIWKYVCVCVCVCIYTHIYTYIYIYTVNHFAVLQKLTQHCKLTIIKKQKKISSSSILLSFSKSI